MFIFNQDMHKNTAQFLLQNVNAFSFIKETQIGVLVLWIATNKYSDSYL